MRRAMFRCRADVPPVRRMPAGRMAALFLLAAFPAHAQTPRQGVVSLAPNLTELVCAMGFGAQLTARSSACDFPPDVTALPIAGDFGRPNLEAIERLRASVVLVTDVENPASLHALRQAGVRCLELSCEGWTNLLGAAESIGRELGDPRRAQRWVEGMRTRRDGIGRRVAGAWNGRARPRVYIEIWKEPLTTTGGGSFLDDLVTLAGGRNISAGLQEKYPRVAPEWVIRENPDAIVLLYMPGKERDAAAGVTGRTGWSGLKAVRNRAISADIAPDLLLRPGPRCLDGVEKLAEFLLSLPAAP